MSANEKADLQISSLNGGLVPEAAFAVFAATIEKLATRHNFHLLKWIPDIRLGIPG